MEKDRFNSEMIIKAEPDALQTISDSTVSIYPRNRADRPPTFHAAPKKRIRNLEFPK